MPIHIISRPDRVCLLEENFSSSGQSLVVVYANDNSFPKWKEFNEMIGLRGWGGLNEKDGPYDYPNPA